MGISTMLRRLLFLVCLANRIWKDPTNIRGGGVCASNIFDGVPSVSLRNNFGVAEGLCIDIAGFGANLNCEASLQLHTCKSQGADTSFVYDRGTQEIRSVEYNSDCESIDGSTLQGGGCLTIGGSIEAGDLLFLDSCTAESELANAYQRFELFEDGTLHVAANPELCLAKTSDVGPAGPNERTDFALTDCASADPLDVTWTVTVTGDPTTPMLPSEDTGVLPNTENMAQQNPQEITDASDSIAESVTTPEIEATTSPTPTPTTSIEDATTTKNTQEVNQDAMASLIDSSAHHSTTQKPWISFVAMSCMGVFMYY